MRHAILALAALATPALAQPVDLAVAPDASSVSAQICLSPPGLSKKCDTDSSAIAGSLSIELDDYGIPGSITLDDFSLQLSSNLSYNMDWGGFIGGVNIQINDLTVAYATPGIPTGPVAVDGSGAFDFPAVQAAFTGTGAYQGYGPILGSLVGSGTFNLADFGTVDSAISGYVSVAAGVVTLTGAQAFSNTGDINGVTTSIDGSATIVASGAAPSCIADFNHDGLVDTRDVLAFLNAWNALDSSSDCDGNNLIDTRDVLCFLNAWNAGC
ncbi:MAG: hypothetical protein IPJ41_01655 [Phycisphaerales bacterium]|nr:hypothetical protein [Phycisphaerales bacterium]